MSDIIFDFDGTIADSLLAVIKVFEDLTTRPKRFTSEEIDAMKHLTLPEIARDLKIKKWKIPILIFKGRRMMQHHLRSIQLHEGMEEALNNLHDKGHRLYILSSNSEKNVSEYMRLHGLHDKFIGIYGGASLFRKAPKLARLMKKEKIDMKHAWYIGDEVRDIMAAKVLGIHSGSVTWGYNTHQALSGKKPDALFDTTVELTNYFK